MTVGPICLDERRFENGDEPMQFTVGFKFEGKVNHVVVDGDDALVAALKLKADEANDGARDLVGVDRAAS